MNENVKGVPLYLTSTDFTRLFDVHMEWGAIWESKLSRFSPLMSLEWKHAYWYYSYANLLLSRAYLESRGYETQTSWDEGQDSYILVTNYDFEKGLS